jgi:hypothetical protein
LLLVAVAVVHGMAVAVVQVAYLLVTQMLMPQA